MREYLEQGVRLGWLLDPDTTEVEIYRPGRPVETLARTGDALRRGRAAGIRARLEGDPVRLRPKFRGADRTICRARSSISTLGRGIGEGRFPIGPEGRPASSGQE
jgi:hypothetical protein